jgi:hypothetical protein
MIELGRNVNNKFKEMEKTPSKPRQINVVLNTSTNPNNESARMDNSRSNSNLLVQRLTDYEVGDV